jgi:methionine aminotransferase
MLNIEHGFEMSDFDFAVELTKSSKIACIPLDVFIQNQPKTNWFRFCFAKNEDTLEQAAEILSKL